MPRNDLAQRLRQLWLLPAELRWMDPLPLAHRRGIIAGVLLILVAFLWPSPAPQPGSAPPTVGRKQPVAEDVAAHHRQQLTSRRTEAENRWLTLIVSEGQTLALLFRNNNLQVNAVFAMAQVEGDDKPLSNLQPGQQVKVRVDARGVVTGLNIAGNKGPVLFIRQSDGSFLRTR